MEYRSPSQGVEVAGAVVAAFMAAFPKGTEQIGYDALAARGIGIPDTAQWYSLQSFLDTMKDVEHAIGPEMLRRIGEHIATHAILPPTWKNLEEVLPGIDVAYHMNHRGGEIGHYEFHDEGFSSGLRRVRIVCFNPYPCPFDHGTLEGFVKRFKPSNCIDALVRHDNTQPCRHGGAQSCTYVISWG